jgi:solute carrier family 50 protein (sugar transporter)
MAVMIVLALTVIAAVIVKSLLFIGIVATVANCVMFAAPLAVMQQVIQTKSVRYMPFLLSFSSFLCATVWLIWALVVSDYFVLIPNALGTFFGLIQLILYGIYWRMTDRNSEDETVQLAQAMEASEKSECATEA